MSTRYPDDVVLPPETRTEEAPQQNIALAAFVPIAIALVGVGGIILGGLTLGGPTTTVASVTRTDPVVTGSVTPAPAPAVAGPRTRDIGDILRELDR